MTKSAKKTGVYTPATPTDQMYGWVSAAFAHFNRELFDGELPADLFTLQRRARSKGYFRRDQFAAAAGDARVGEIALNPAYFLVTPELDSLSTLVHEMCHSWRARQEKPSRPGYHDRIWAEKMTAIGLQPSNTGAVGGKTTGYQMDHYLVPAGPFEESFFRFCALGLSLEWGDAITKGAEAKPAKPKRFKFVCPSCGVNVYGREATDVLCHPCMTVMVLASSAPLISTKLD